MMADIAAELDARRSPVAVTIEGWQVLAAGGES
jgi:hypothetical protein